MIDRKRLRELAAKATPGPWLSNAYQANWEVWQDDSPDAGGGGRQICSDIETVADAVFIAACSPDVILELLDRLEKAEDGIRAATDLLSLDLGED